MNFAILPNLVALAVLVAVFWAIAGRTPSQRLYFWLVGWILVLLHFAAEFLSSGRGLSATVFALVSVDALILAAVAFLTSVLDGAFSQPWRFALCVAAPSLAYASAVVCEVRGTGLYAALTLGGAIAGWIADWSELSRNKLRRLWALGGSAALIGSCLWSVARGAPDLGILVALGALNFAVAILFANAYRRLSAGVISTVIGFSLWGSVFPLAFVLETFAPGFKVGGEAWNIPKYVVAVGMILTLFEDQIDTSKYHAHHDELTGLPNRRLLEDRLGLALAYARRAKTKVAILQLDLNRFKEVNDTLGHRAGDVALREIAARLATCMHPGDTLARSGGDEFTVVSHFEDRRSADALVAALETTLSAPILVDGKEIQTGLSIGMAVYPDDGGDRDQLHAAADRAMYAVKRAGRHSSADESDVADFSVRGHESATIMPSSK